MSTHCLSTHTHMRVHARTRTHAHTYTHTRAPASQLNHVDVLGIRADKNQIWHGFLIRLFPSLNY